MLNWIAANLSTILIALGLAAVVAAIIVGIVKDKQQGRSSCSGSCGHCPMNCSCCKH